MVWSDSLGCFVVPVGLFWFCFCRIGFELVASCCFMCAWVVGLELVVWLFVGWLLFCLVLPG